MESRIYLRALEPDDYRVSVTWRNDEQVSAMVGGRRYFVSAERERRWVEEAIADDRKSVLAICLKEDGRHIGNIMLQEVDYINRSAHMPVLIGDRSQWNKGYATEARMILLKYAFDELGLERVFAFVLEENAASIRMHEKCGYKREGLLRRSVYKGGRFHNQVVMAVLREEFEQAYQEYVTG